MDEVAANSTIGPFLRSLIGGTGHENIQNITTTTVNTIIDQKTILSNLTTTHAPRSHDLDIRRANFVWPEDPVDEMPLK